MKFRFVHATLALTVFAISAAATARETVLPAGTLLQCTLNEPNFSSATAEVGDPVLCHLRGMTSFGQQAFPRGSYLVGHLEAAKDPGHFFGKGYIKLQFDRIGLPNGDLPLEAKVVSTRNYKVDKHGDIDGKGHAKRDVVEWLLPPLWPWKIVMLPARGPRPALKGETVLSLRLMDDVQLPQVASNYSNSSNGWHVFSTRPQRQSYSESGSLNSGPQLTIRGSVATANAQVSASIDVPHASYASYVSSEAPLSGPVIPATGPVFILNSGTVLAVGAYQYQDSRITYTLSHGGGGVISTDEVDWKATTRVNNQRGVRLTLHAGHEVASTSGL